MRRARTSLALAAVLGLIVVALAAALWVQRPSAERVSGASSDPGAGDAERGAYLVRLGNCGGCHTRPGGEALAGGRRLETAFGTFVTPNITPDRDTGIGAWSRTQFRGALLGGQRADGAPLYPACPYPRFTHARPADIDAVYAHLQSREPVTNATAAHELDFPYSLRPLLHLWQWAFFEPGGLASAPERSDEWRRGRYLVEGLGHCKDCHKRRGAFGAIDEAPSAAGGSVDGWYAPSLNHPDEAGLQGLSVDQGARLLRSGKIGDHVMLGPMAAVVFDSLQHLSEADARAMATYLRALPPEPVRGQRAPIGPTTADLERQMVLGERLYDERCADCHGDQGEGRAGIVALAGNRAVTQVDPANVFRMIRDGGFPAATPGHPHPYGMPPYPQMTERELAAVTNYIRRSWGNEAPPVSATAIAD